MKCPLCQVELQIADRQGIEIDYCPQCRGVWLDRGELDKLIERSASFTQSESPAYRSSEKSRDRDDDKNYRPRKKESFWSELFDFG